MKAYDGQDVMELYVATLSEQPSIKEDEIWWIKRSTTITLVNFGEDGFSFRFETSIPGGGLPVCQYVTIKCDGEMVFRDEWQWFTPGDILWNTFAEAMKYSEAVALVQV